MTDKRQFLINAIDEYLNEDNSKNLDGDLSALITELNNIITSSTFNADKLAGLSEVNEEVLTEDEISIIKYFSVIGNISKDENNISHIDITSSQVGILKDIKNRLEGIVKNNVEKDDILELKNQLISNPTDINIDVLRKFLEECDLSDKFQCEIILDLLKETTRNSYLEEEVKYKDHLNQLINEPNPDVVVENLINDSDANLSYGERVKIIEDLLLQRHHSFIKGNANNTTVYNNKTSDEIKDIRKLAEKYDILNFINKDDFSKLTEYRDQESLCQTLSALFEYSNNNLTSYSDELLYNVLLLSDKSIISYIGEMLKVAQIDFSEFIKIHYNVLLSNKYADNLKATMLSKKDLSYTSFFENVEILSEMGLNIGVILKRSPSSLTYDSNIILNNALTLSDQYGINIDEKNLSTLQNISTIRSLDKLIESSDVGFEWIKDKITLLFKCTKKVNMALKFEKDSVVTNKDGKINIDLKKASSIGDNHLSELVSPRYDSREFDFCNKVLGNSRDNLFTNITDDIFNQTNVKVLEDNFKVDDVTYIVDELRVSRPKVLRVLQALLNQPEKDNSDKDSITENEVLYALSYESLLSVKDALTVVNYKKYINKHERVRNDG